MSDDCGCCEGGGAAAAEPTDNPPGRAALSYRVGTHATFLRAMVARLGALQAEAGVVGRGGADGGGECMREAHRSFLLGGDPDATTALLDGFACVADVLTFYQERIVNEGYLRTATERRSVVELGRLTGYAPRPGVAASADLAFTVQDGFDGEVPARTKVQSTPRPGQDAQTFETSEALAARAEWNAMRPRPRATGRFIRYEHYLPPVQSSHATTQGYQPTGRVEIFLRGIGQRAAPGDVVYLPATTRRLAGDGLFQNNGLFRVQRVSPDVALDHAVLRLVPFEGDYHRGGEWESVRVAFTAPDAVARPRAGSEGSAAPVDIEEARSLLTLYRRVVERLFAAGEDPTSFDRSNAATDILNDVVNAEIAAVRADETSPRELRDERVRARNALWADFPRLPDLAEGLDLLAYDDPSLRGRLLSTLAAVAPPTAGERGVEAWVFRASATAFGRNASLETVQFTLPRERELHDIFLRNGFQQLSQTPLDHGATVVVLGRERRAAWDEQDDALFVDGDLPTVRAGDFVVLVAPPYRGDEFPSVPPPYATAVYTLREVASRSRSAYGVSGAATWMRLDRDWWDTQREEGGAEFPEVVRAPITALRNAQIYTRAEPLDLVPELLDEDVANSSVDLDGVITPLASGRLLLVEGERTDLPGIAGLRAVELVRAVSTTAQTRERRAPNEPEPSAETPSVRAAPYTWLTFSPPLRHTYKRSSVVVRGNVAHATHGETRDEVLGSGDASVPDQRFTLRQGPRTWVSAVTPTGVASTLEVRANAVLWPEAPSIAGLGPRDEVVVARTLGDGKDEVKGGDGRRGVRFPTGVENLTARYRVGLGARGNVDAGLLTTLMTRPLGVREVTNPARASGGADPDGRDAIRARIPVASRGVDRLVTVRDHADFALNFAGVEKALAWRDVDEHGVASVAVVVAGAEDVPIDPSSDLFRNLRAAFLRFGDPATRVALSVARPVPLRLVARVRVAPRYEWPRVEPALREALYAEHGWAARGVGEPVLLSTWLRSLQAVPGVAMVDVDRVLPLGDLGVDEQPRGDWHLRVARDVVAYFSRSLPDAVVFTQVTP
ncbi:MAG: baseplate J/gp47 family protein [Polyangiales bacterium]